MRGFHPPAKSPAGARGFNPAMAAAFAQAQNQAPDSIHAMVKPGEFVLPPDTVHAMGGPEALQGVVDATHTPVRHAESGFSPRVSPGEPRMFFANGGLVEEEKPNTPSPSNTFPGNRLPGDSGTTSAAPPTPTPTPTPAPGPSISDAKRETAIGQIPTDGTNAPNINNSTAGAERGVINPSMSPPMAEPSVKPPALDTATATQDTGTANNILPGVYQHGRGQYSDNAQGMGFASGFTGKPSAQSMAVADALTESVPGGQRGFSPGALDGAAPATETATGARGFAPSAAPSGQRSPVGMSVEQAQREGLIGERVGYNPAYDQRLKGARGFAPDAQSTYNPGAMVTSEWARDLAMRNASVGSTIHRNQGEAMMANKARQANIAGVRGAIAAQMHDAQQADTARYQSDNTLAGNVATGQMRQQVETTRTLLQQALGGIRERRAAQQKADQTDIARQRLALDTKRAGFLGVPAGYRPKSDGTLEAIPGGPADPATQAGKKPLNDTQAKALQFGARMLQSGQSLDALASSGVTQPGYFKRTADALGVGALANWTQSPQQQQVEQSQRDFVNAVLRRESGAAISNSEFDNARAQYFPQPGDSQEVIQQKRRNREIATRGVLTEVPEQQNRVQQVLSEATQAQPGQQRAVARTGTINGRKVVQYADGSISYAD